MKYLLRTRLFIHKYMDEIDAMYDMTPEELKAFRNSKDADSMGFWGKE